MPACAAIRMAAVTAQAQDRYNARAFHLKYGRSAKIRSWLFNVLGSSQPLRFVQ